MKKLIWALAALIVMAGCQSPVKVDDPARIVVKNSLWDTVKTIVVSDRGAREIVGDDYQTEIEAYNAETMDDFLRAYAEGEVPDIENAPPVSVFIVNPTTYEVNWSAENIPRISLVENAAAWRRDAYGQILFIDHVPPPPVIEPPADPYAYFAIYGIDENGLIIYEDHCGYRDDREFYQEDIGDYASPEVYYPLRVNQITHEVQTHAGWTLHADHTLYTEPFEQEPAP